MDTGKDDLSLVIAGFKVSDGNKGDLYRRPLGIFDNGDRLSFAFVSSRYIKDEEAITDIKGPGDNFM